MRKLAIITSLLGCAAVGALFFVYNAAREEVRAYCQPRGYVGGYLDKYSGSGCIAADGSRVSIRTLKD